MREVEFKQWLQGEGYDPATVTAQLARVARLEREYGDFDNLHVDGRLEQLQQDLAYSKNDERAGKPSPTLIQIEGDLYAGLASLRKTIDYYRQFIESGGGPSKRRAHAALVARVTASEIEATMDDCDKAGVDKFLHDNGYARPKVWAVRLSNGARYPAKAIVGVAIGKLPGQTPLHASEYFGGFGESQSFARLEQLGYTIIGREGAMPVGSPLSRDSVEAAMDEYDALGEAAFLAKYERGRTGIRYWVRRNGIAYPSKAIANAAFEIQNGRRGTYGGTEARQRLSRLGYEITARDGEPVSGEGDERDDLEASRAEPANLILYGPPGTGKTYATALEAVRLCRPDLGDDDELFLPENRADLLEEYGRLKRAGQIDFVTFHQSYSYEDFVEGLRPPTPDSDEDGGTGLRLEVRPGVFSNIAAAAGKARLKPAGGARISLEGRRFFKMSLGRAGKEDHIYEAAIQEGYAVLGFGGDMDWSDPKYAGKEGWQRIFDRWKDIDPATSPNSGNVAQLWCFRSGISNGDIVVVSNGNKRFRAIGEVVSDYAFQPTGERDYNHVRRVNWLFDTEEPLPVELIYGKPFTQISCYELRRDLLNHAGIERLLSPKDASHGSIDQFVLVIDEINRANISKVFGELITLIEKDKRLGQQEQITVRLPYSGREFGVPDNLHIIGTMNTADRSIALLDTALRRRFRFKEMPPRSDLLEDAAAATGLPLAGFLQKINDRIEYLLDREHRIGHAFFINCRSREDVDAAMRNAVIPLLQEYFFEDLSRVAAVLGEPRQKGGLFLACRRIESPLPDGGGDTHYSWEVIPEWQGFAPDAYQRSIGGSAAAAAIPGDGEAEAGAAE